MLLKTNNSVVNLVKVEAVIEKRFDFNGKGYRMLEVSNEINDANAILLHIADDSNVNMFAPAPKADTILVGNLENRVVRSSMIDAVENGYVDISGIKFQDFEPDPNKYLFDNGYMSPPYILKGFLALSGFNTPCFSLSGVEKPFMNKPEDEDEWDSFEKNDDSDFDDEYDDSDDEYGDYDDYVIEDDNKEVEF